MSAICGVIDTQSRPVDGLLSAMMNALAFMGGDAAGSWREDAVALGQHSRWLTPQDRAGSPIYQEHGLVIAADARLDGRAALLAELGIDAGEGKNLSDPALIARVYRRWGDETAAHLVGDFAFAVWDSARAVLLCGRDPVGVRPLFYLWQDGRLMFATDELALCGLPGLPLEADEDSLTTLFQGRHGFYYDPRHTFYRNLFRLPYGHSLRLQDGHLRVWATWTPPQDDPLTGSFDSLTEQARALVEQAVSDRLRVDVRAGAHLSGGVDSSSVAVLAARQLRARGQTLPVFSWSPPGPTQTEPFSEHARMRAICAQEDLTLTYAPGIPRPFLYDTPRPNQLLQQEHGVAEAARDQDVRFMLSGWGGDEFISYNGRGYRADLFARGRWGALAHTFDWSRLPRGLVNNAAYLWRDVILPLLPESVYPLMPEGAGYRHNITHYLRPDFAARVKQRPRRLPPLRYQERGVKRTQRRLYAQGHLADRMERWAVGGAAYGITYTFPLTDRRILDFAFRLPDEVFIQAGLLRHFYRQASAPWFPPGMFDQRETRTKTEPTLLRHQAQLLRFIEQRTATDSITTWVHDPALSANPWVDVRKLRADAARLIHQQLAESERLAFGAAVLLLNVWRTMDQQAAVSQPLSTDSLYS